LDADEEAAGNRAFLAARVNRAKSRERRMSVLVTGGAGYIGGHMTLGLLDAGESVVVLDNLSTGFAWAVSG